MSANFLAHSHSEGLAYKTINTYCSCLSSSPISHQLIIQILANAPRIIKVMRGIGLTNPPTPRYSHTWDVKIVTNYIQSLNENKQLPLKTLSHELAVFLLYHRVEGLAKSLLLTSNILLKNQKEFYLAFQFSPQKGSSSPKEVLFPRFPFNPKLCVVSCITDYMDRTSTLRSDDRLLVSYKKLYRHISSSTLAR